MNDIIEIPKCKVCWNNVSFIKYSKWYNTYCSWECVNRDPEIIKKRESTNLKKYWTKHGFSNASIKDK